MDTTAVHRDRRITFADLLTRPGVTEDLRLGGRIGVMAFHGGSLEQMTDVIADRAAAAAGASFYAVRQPTGTRIHIASHRVRPEESPALAAFMSHVDVVVTVHGYGRQGMFTSLLFGGSNRPFARHLVGALGARLPAYRLVDDLERIPTELRGQHPGNPVNLPPAGGVQIELPPRVRGSSPLWWDWEHGLTPHTEALIEGLAEGLARWPG